MKRGCKCFFVFGIPANDEIQGLSENLQDSGPGSLSAGVTGRFRSEFPS
jgi:hypothetical protein